MEPRGRDEKRRALVAELKRLRAEQERLRTRDDLDAWRRHVAALTAFQADVDRWRALSRR